MSSKDPLKTTPQHTGTQRQPGGVRLPHSFEADVLRRFLDVRREHRFVSVETRESLSSNFLEIVVVNPDRQKFLVICAPRGSSLQEPLANTEGMRVRIIHQDKWESLSHERARVREARLLVGVICRDMS